MQKAAQVGLADSGLSGGDVIQSSAPQPVLELIHQAEQMIEAVHDEQQRLIMIDLKALVYQPFDLQRISLYVGRSDRMFEFSERTQQPTAIGAQLTAGPHQAELHREPKEPRH